MSVFEALGGDDPARPSAIWRWILVLGWSIATIGCATAHIPDAPVADPASPLRVPLAVGEYRIEVGDHLEVRSYYDPDLSHEVLVRPDGKISTLFVGDVEAEGLTIPRLESRLSDQYLRFVEASAVTVSLRPRSRRFYVTGEVENPGGYDLDGPVTLLDAINLAGGASATADLHQVLLLRRWASGDFQAYHLDVAAVLAGVLADAHLRPHDVVVVPKSLISKVNLVFQQYVNRMIPDAVRTTVGVLFGAASLAAF